MIGSMKTNQMRKYGVEWQAFLLDDEQVPDFLLALVQFYQLLTKWKFIQAVWNFDKEKCIDRLNSRNFEIFYPSEFYSILSGRIKSVLKIIQNDINLGC